jgi:hypothetical protein
VAKVCGRLAEGRLCGCGIAQVGLHHLGPAAQGADFLHHLLGFGLAVVTMHQHIGAGAGQGQGDAYWSFWSLVPG